MSHYVKFCFDSTFINLIEVEKFGKLQNNLTILNLVTFY